MWPVIIGPANLGKTLFVRNILPLSMQDAGLHGQALSLQDKKRDEVVRKITSELVCELPELAGVQAKDSEYLKDVLSMSKEKARILHRSWESNFIMTCAFIGTANPDKPMLPPNDPALTLRLPFIEITDSPWGDEEQVDDQMNAEDEALKRRLWRGWMWWYANGYNPELMPSREQCSLILDRAVPFTYVDVGTLEAVDAVTEILRRNLRNDAEMSEGEATHSMMHNGLMSIDIVRMLDEARYRLGSSMSAVRIGTLLKKNSDWVQVGGNTKGHRWVCRSLCQDFHDRLTQDGNVRKQAESIGLDLTLEPNHGVSPFADDSLGF